MSPRSRAAERAARTSDMWALWSRGRDRRKKLLSTTVGGKVAQSSWWSVRDARRKHSGNFHVLDFPSAAIANFRGNFRNLTLTRARKFLGEFLEIWIRAKLLVRAHGLQRHRPTRPQTPKYPSELAHGGSSVALWLFGGSLSLNDHSFDLPFLLLLFVLPLRRIVSPEPDRALAMPTATRRPSHRLAIVERGRTRQRSSKSAKALASSCSRRPRSVARIRAVHPLSDALTVVCSDGAAALRRPGRSRH